MTFFEGTSAFIVCHEHSVGLQAQFTGTAGSDETVDEIIPYIDVLWQMVGPWMPLDKLTAVSNPESMFAQPSGGHWSHDFMANASSGHQGIVLHHIGALEHAGIEELVARAEAWSLDAADGVVVRKRLLNVLVESLENMRLHAEPQLATTSFAVLTSDAGSYRLFIGNAVPAATAALLQHRIEVINEMSEADIKEHFLRLLSNESRTVRGGAGLGLLTIARKGNRPLVPHSIERDETTRYFVLEVLVLRD